MNFELRQPDEKQTPKSVGTNLARRAAGINQHKLSVKTIVTTFALSLALCAAAGATAQVRNTVPTPKADTVLLSETTGSDYIERRYEVKNQHDTEYTVRYQINLATLNATLNGNSKQLDELNAFVGDLMKDTLLRVKSVTITGYSSPDGPRAFNESLAARRARDFKNYVDRKYDFSKKFDVTVHSVAEDWEMCRELVSRSQMPDRQAVLTVIDGTQGSEAKEAALKQMPAAWDYMKANILPPIRRVVMDIAYGGGKVIVERIPIACPEPPQPQEQACEPSTPCPPQNECSQCDCYTIDESITGLIVEMPEPGTDFTPTTYEGRHAIREDARRVETYSERAERKAGHVGHKDRHGARKISRKEAKALKKAEKAAIEAAREADNL